MNKLPSYVYFQSITRWTGVIRQIPFYPFLFIFYTILNLVTSNFDQIDPSLAVRPLLLISSVSIFLLGLFFFKTKNWRYSCYLLFCLLVFIFLFGHLNRILQNILLSSKYETASFTFLIFWSLGFLFLTRRRVWDWLEFHTHPEKFLTIFMIFSLIYPCLLFIFFMKNRQTILSTMEEKQPFQSKNITLQSENRPDIYYIILDGYGRQDSLNELYHLDTSNFTKFLLERGFYIGEKSHTNYTITVFSLASSLNFDYLSDWNIPPIKYGFQEYTKHLIANSQTAQLLRDIGYQFITFDTGFYYTNIETSETYLSPFINITEFDQLLFTLSPFEIASEYFNLRIPTYSYVTGRTRIDYILNQLNILPKMNSPKFVFVHILSPHPPFMFDKEGNSVQPSRPYFFGDGVNYYGTQEEYISGYNDQVTYINKRIEEAIISILDESSEPPIIILQGDHGPGSRLHTTPENSCLWERAPILNAYYFPDTDKGALYDTISPVNSFRLVLIITSTRIFLF